MIFASHCMRAEIISQHRVMSSIVRLTGLDDFITPSQACIKPLEPEDVPQGAAPGVTIAIEHDGE